MPLMIYDNSHNLYGKCKILEEESTCWFYILVSSVKNKDPFKNLLLGEYGHFSSQKGKNISFRMNFELAKSFGVIFYVH